jgi:hypothetical protein
LRVPRSEVFCESLSSGKTPNSGTVLWSNGKKEVLAENSRILASRRATTTITLEEGILVVVESRNLKRPLLRAGKGRLTDA